MFHQKHIGKLSLFIMELRDLNQAENRIGENVLLNCLNQKYAF